MPIDVTCSCGKSYKLDDKLAGKRVRCKVCRAEIVVPEDVVDGAALEQLPAPPPPLPPATTAVAHHPIAAPTPVEPEVPYPDDRKWSSRASNPALLRFEAAPYFRNNLGSLAGFVALGSLSIPLLVRGSAWPGYWLFAPAPVVLAIAWLIYDIMKTSGKLAYGCVNPAIVVGEKPWRIAIYADLSKGGAHRPAIRVETINLKNIVGGPPQIGMPLATVSLYQSADESDAWTDFDPTLVQLATSKLPQAQRVVASIPAKDWDALANGMARVDVTRDGLYKLWISNKNVYKLNFTPAAEWGIGVVIWALFFLMFCVVGPAKPKRSNSVSSTTPAPTAPAPITPAPTTPAPVTPAPVRPAPAIPTPAPQPAAPKPAAPIPAAPKPAIPKPSAPTSPAPGSPAPSASAVEKDDSLEKVEIFWGNKWWKGRVLKRENGKLLVHYDGWASTYDEWVTPDKVRPLAK